jgi:hypothetical protein
MSEHDWNDAADDEDPDEGEFDDEPDTMPCPSCGAEIFDDVDRCPVCGEYITADTSMNPVWWWTAVIVLLLMVWFFVKFG